MLHASIDLCAELGGSYLVHGSPAQRRVATPDDAARAEEAWLLAGEQAALARVAYCIEPLARPECNFVNTLAEAAEIVRRLGNPALRIMVDTLAAGLMEPEPVADAIRRWMPTGLLAHVQFNDRNRRGPGQGDDRFGPVVRALRETGYGGWIAMEPFVYRAGRPDLCRAHDRLRRGPPGAGRMKVKLEEVERYERHAKLRLPFRFGVITVTDATQAVIRVRVSLADGRTSQGVAAEALAAKWFEKSPEFTDEENLQQLRAVARSCDRPLSRAGAGADRSICSSRPTRSNRSGRGARPQSAGCVLRAGAARPRHPRCRSAGRPANPSPT